MERKNLDIYVTGSNSKMLSKDIVTNFRDRGSEIKVFPLSFKEFYPMSGMEKADALEEYLTYGGMPLAVLEQDETEKRKYLKGLHKRVYIKDIVERYKLKDDEVLEALIDALSSAVGSLTNPHNLANAAGTLMKRSTSDNTIKNHLDYLEEAYLFVSAQRYDIKGKRYFENTLKYYSMDTGLRNAKLNFRQQEKSHLMENMIFIELIRRGYSVDVGVVELVLMKDGKKQQSQYEIDSIVNTGREKVYIQSALNVDTETKSGDLLVAELGRLLPQDCHRGRQRETLDRRGWHHVYGCHPVSVGGRGENNLKTEISSLSSIVTFRKILIILIKLYLCRVVCPSYC